MAATRLIALHRNKGKTVLQALADRTKYAMNPDKTEDGLLVTGYECDPRTVNEEFMLTKREYSFLSGLRNNNEVIAYQLRQSFKPGEVTPEEANQIGKELALRFTKGNFAFIVATHTDRAHIHNHIIFNSTRLDGKRKFRNFWRSGLVLQRVSDLVCLEHGLSVITPRPYGEREKYTDYSKRQTVRKRITEDIETILAEKPMDFQSFLESLQGLGYEIKDGPHLAVKGSAQKKFVRLDSLPEGYREADIRNLLGGEASGSVGHPDRKVNLLIDVQQKLRDKGAGYANWATRFNVKQMAKSVLFIRDHGIDSMNDLEVLVGDRCAKQEETLNRVKACEDRLAEISRMKQHIVNYAKTKEVYKAFCDSGYDGRFFEDHREEITLHRAAQKEFDRLMQAGESIPKVAELNEEFQKTLRLKRELYTEFKKTRDQYKEALIVQENLRSLFRLEENSQAKDRKKEKEY